jgi:glycine dehydrogenase
LKSIWNEINEIKEGKADREDNVLHNAPHTVRVVSSDSWSHPDMREKAAFPLRWITENKLWPTVGRVDDGYGDRNLVVTCDSIDEEREKMFE